MAPILKLPTLDKQIPHDAVTAIELLRRAHEQVKASLADLDRRIAMTAATVPTLPEISRALSSGGVAPVNVSGGVGSLPPSPGDDTVYLNGAPLPVFARVQDAHLLLFDLLANNVSTLMHGFMPKLTGNPGEVLNGAGAWVSLATSAQLWAPVTNGDPVSPEILFDSNGEVIMGSEPGALVI